MTGLRMGVNSAWHGLIVAELFGSSKGLGYLTMSSGNNFDTAGLFVGLIILVTLSVGSVNFMGWLEHRMSSWRSQVIV
jgi:NitT/TauT family transport system permease protein